MGAYHMAVVAILTQTASHMAIYRIYTYLTPLHGLLCPTISYIPPALTPWFILASAIIHRAIASCGTTACGWVLLWRQRKFKEASVIAVYSAVI